MGARDHIDFVQVDGRNVAFQVAGQGDRDLLLVHEWTTPLLDRWEQPRIADVLRRLGERFRVISFDRRGIGLSDPAPLDEMTVVEEWGRDVVAVLDAVGAETVDAVGMSDGSAPCLWLAATEPHRVNRLVLVHTAARLLEDHGYPGSSRALSDLVIAGVPDDWRTGDSFPLFLPSLADDEAARRWYHRARLRQASPATAQALFRAAFAQDLRPMLPAVTQPVLVMQPAEPTTIGRHAPAQGRYIAEHVADGRLEGLVGHDDIWWAANGPTVADSILRFVADVAPGGETERVLMTVAFTDLVSSTEQLVASGDRAWRSVLDVHDAMVRDRADAYGGVVVKTTGDGALLRFDGPARGALHCLLDLRDEIADLGLHARAGVHTGECEVRGDDLAGVAVHVAARVGAAAPGGEVWATATVRDLVAGSSLQFEPRGSLELKGLGEREVFAATRDRRSSF